MKPNFSFKYNGNLIKASELMGEETACGIVYAIDNDVTVTAKVKCMPEFDAIEWVLYFENKSDKNSGIISEIKDADIVLPLDMPTPPKNGYRPEKENVCVITMRGAMDAGAYYYNRKDNKTAEEYGLIYEYLDIDSIIPISAASTRSDEPP